MELSPSSAKMCEVFDFFLDKSLEPLQAEHLMKISQRIEREKAKRYSEMMIRTVKSNSAQEFQDIIIENQIYEKLQKLDELKQSDGVPVNMKTFTFTPAKKEDLRSREEYKAKEQFLQQLHNILDGLNQKMEELTPRAQAAEAKVAAAEKKIADIQGKLSNPSLSDSSI